MTRYATDHGTEVSRNTGLQVKRARAGVRLQHCRTLLAHSLVAGRIRRQSRSFRSLGRHAGRVGAGERRRRLDPVTDAARLSCSYRSTAAIQGRVIRMCSPQHAVDEIRRLVDAGFRRFYFVDNSFNIPEPYAISLCRLLEEASLDIEWLCILYPQRVDEHLLRALSRTGCVEVSLGFESGNATILRHKNKHYTPADVRCACDLLKQYHIRRMGFLLLGGPGETQRASKKVLPSLIHFISTHSGSRWASASIRERRSPGARSRKA